MRQTGNGVFQQCDDFFAVDARRARQRHVGGLGDQVDEIEQDLFGIPHQHLGQLLGGEVVVVSHGDAPLGLAASPARQRLGNWCGDHCRSVSTVVRNLAHEATTYIGVFGQRKQHHRAHTRNGVVGVSHL